MPARPIVRHDHDDNLDFASVSIHRRVDVVTTTLYSSPGSTGIAASNASSVPIPAIAGGACAGVALAIIAVVGWKWWGRSIEKEQQRLRQDKAAKIYEKSVTSDKKDSRISTPVGRTPASSLSGKSKNNASLHAKTRSPDLPLEKDSASGSTSSLNRSLSHLPLNPPSNPSKGAEVQVRRAVLTRPAHARPGPSSGRNYLPSRPTPLSHGRSKRRLEMASVPPVPSLPPSAQLMAGTTRSRNPAFISASEKDATHHLATKPSSVSSDSYYSTQSGEERRIRNQGSVSSALAQARRLSSHTRSSTSDNSGYSTADEHPWRSSWRFAWNSGGPTGRNRLSAATSSSIVTRPEDIPGVPIGVAFGGEDDDPLQTISEQDQGHPSGASKNPRHHVERKPFSGRNR